MTNEQLVALIKARENIGDNMLQLWEQNKRFIHIIALKFQGKAELEDLEQEGYLALYDAIDGYNADSSYKFLTYAKYWIIQRMERYIKNNSTVRIPEHELAKISGYKKIANACQIHLGRKPTRHEIAHIMGLSYKVIIDLEKAAGMAKLRSLDSVLSMDDDSVTVGDMVPSDMDIEEDVLERVQQEELKTILWPLVDELPEQQGQVLRQRYQECKTLKATGICLGLTMEQVRQMEAKAMRNLRCSRKRKMLEPFLEDEIAYSMGVTGTSVKCFERTWTSSTERVALHRLEKWY